MKSYSKKMVGIFFLLSMTIFLTGCFKSVKKNDEKLETVIIAGSAEDGNEIEGSDLNQKASTKTWDINLNQIGYRRKDKKIAVIRNTDGDSHYRILDEEGNKVFSGKLQDDYYDEDYNETLYYADFSKFEKEGTYCLMCGDKVVSPLFEISDRVYDDIGQIAIKPFASGAYFKASLMDDEKKQEKKRQQERDILVKRSQAAKVLETDQRIDVSGGWCSASSEGWFTVPSITSLANMMYLNEYHRAGIEKMAGQTKQSKISLEQIIKEELEWLLKMQNSNSGGVYHKAASKDGSMNSADKQVYVSAISSCATADFAAIMARASRNYRDTDRTFSYQCLYASRKAWRYLKEHKGDVSFSNEEEITSRTYSDYSDKDERFWAATELYLATWEDEFLQEMKGFDVQNTTVDFGWSLVSGYALFDYYRLAENKDGELYKRVRERLQKEVEQTKKRKERGYLINQNYAVSSHQQLLNRGMLVSLMNQTKGKKDSKDVQCVHEYLNYIMGQNPKSQNAFSRMQLDKSEQTLEISSALLLMLQGINV